MRTITPINDTVKALDPHWNAIKSVQYQLKKKQPKKWPDKTNIACFIGNEKYFKKSHEKIGERNTLTVGQTKKTQKIQKKTPPLGHQESAKIN